MPAQSMKTSFEGNGRLRPQNIAEMKAVFARLCTEQGFRNGLSFQPQSTDILISPYVKNGTTWMQQIVHGLRTGGAMDFDEILQVIPWIELAYDMGIDLNGQQVAKPRAFKSHLPWDLVPKGARYIVVFRDPVDALASMHRFLDGWMFEKGIISLADYARTILSQSHGWWEHAVSWWRQSQRQDVLMITFDQMKNDLEKVVDQVADFVDSDITASVRHIACEQATFGFMKEFEARFDDHLLRERRDEACGLPPGGVATKVAKGSSGDGFTSLPDDVLQLLEARWAKSMFSEFGFKSYSEFARRVDERSLP